MAVVAAAVVVAPSLPDGPRQRRGLPSSSAPSSALVRAGRSARPPPERDVRGQARARTPAIHPFSTLPPCRHEPRGRSRGRGLRGGRDRVRRRRRQRATQCRRDARPSDTTLSRSEHGGRDAYDERRRRRHPPILFPRLNPRSGPASCIRLPREPSPRSREGGG